MSAAVEKYNPPNEGGIFYKGYYRNLHAQKNMTRR
jgi:hypothetical protein